MTKLPSTTVDQASREQLKTLLGLASRPPGLRKSASLMAKAPSLDELCRLLSELCGEAREPGELLLATICDEQTPVEALRSIKDIAKELRIKARSETHRNAATLLYHAAIAAAFAWHGVNLSSRPIEVRCDLYEDLGNAFAGDVLGDAFRRAVDRAMEWGEVL
jgi:hypothetical protein